MGSASISVERRVGQTLVDKYRVVRLLGAGGMGAVYEARNTWTRRRVAIKFLRAELTEDPDAVARFRQEAQTATAISHPHIVDVLDMGRDPTDGSIFIVQEFLAGGTLRQYLDEVGKLSLEEALDVAIPIMGALIAAHRHGILHRDVKPDNIILVQNTGGRPFPKLIDFGISKVIAVSTAVVRETTTGVSIGTPRYMSPEQLRGEKGIDGRTDVWAMGIVLYEMLAGSCPFDGVSVYDLVSQLLTSRPVPLDIVVPGLSADLAAVAHRAIEPKLDQRLGSMLAFLEAILACPSLAERPPDQALSKRHHDAIVGRRQVEIPGDDDLGDPAPSFEAPAPHPLPATRAPARDASRPGEGAGGHSVGRREQTTARNWRPAASMLLAAAGLVAAASVWVVSRSGRASNDAPVALPAGPVAAAAPVVPSPDVVDASLPAARTSDADGGPGAVVLSAPPVPVAQAAFVKLRITATPVEADVYRFADGIRVGKTPYQLKAPRSPGVAVYLVKAAGFRDEQVELATDKDNELEVRLTALPRVRRAPRSGQAVKIESPAE